MNQIQDVPIRSQLHADMSAAWVGADKPLKQHDGPPLLPKSKNDLPYSIVSEPQVEQVKMGLRRVSQKLTYTLTYFASWPLGTTIAEEKVRIANLIFARLSLNPGYSVASDRMIHTVMFEDAKTGNSEPYYKMDIVFECTVVETF